jgi:hypothetical protein
MNGDGCVPLRRSYIEYADGNRGGYCMGTFLAPIEKPKGLINKLVYAGTRRQFGKVLTP